jgi:hypothetical protein
MWGVVVRETKDVEAGKEAFQLSNLTLSTVRPDARDRLDVLHIGSRRWRASKLVTDPCTCTCNKGRCIYVCDSL